MDHRGPGDPGIRPTETVALRSVVWRVTRVGSHSSGAQSDVCLVSSHPWTLIQVTASPLLPYSSGGPMVQPLKIKYSAQSSTLMSLVLEHQV